MMQEMLLGLSLELWTVFAAVFIAALLYLSSRPSPKPMSAAAPAPVAKPVPVDLRCADLALHDGTHAGEALWLAADGFVFNVEAGRDFYGPGSTYAGFAGRCVGASASACP